MRYVGEINNIHFHIYSSTYYLTNIFLTKPWGSRSCMFAESVSLTHVIFANIHFSPTYITNVKLEQPSSWIPKSTISWYWKFKEIGIFWIFGIRISDRKNGMMVLPQTRRSNIRNLLPSAKQLYNIRFSSTNHSLVKTNPTVDLKLFSK